jgi:magnesium transporter
MPFFVSRLVGQPVFASAGQKLGVLRDVVIGLDGRGYPPVKGLVVRRGKRDHFVASSDLAVLKDDRIELRRDELPADVFQRRDGEVLIEHDILDRQVIDVQAARVVRANDARVDLVEDQWRLVSIDIGGNGLLRRLGPRWLIGSLEGHLLDWVEVEPLASTVPEVRLHIPHDKLAKLHPSDIARIVDSLAYPQGSEIMQALDDATAADTLEEIEEGRQIDILESLPPARAAKILDEMAPDAAADLLDGLPREQADRLIALMQGEEAAAVELLLSYPERSAGGIMTTDFVIALEHETTRQAVEYVRAQIDKPDLVYYIYVVDTQDNQCLLGITSLRDLLLAEPDQALSSFMHTDVKTVRPEASAAEAARLMTEYNLLALPVTDDRGRMLGLVTADDALEYLLPASLKRHVPRFFS